MSNIIEAITNTVVFLFTIGNNPQPIGTGFIIGYPFPNNKDMVVPLIVTAKHVLGDQKKILVRFSTQEGSATTFVEYDIEAMKRNNDYWEYPDDEGVDIAVFRSPHFEKTKYQFLPIDLIATEDTFEENSIRQTDRIIFPCLLVNFMGSEQNYPIVRDGIIALMPREKVPLEFKVGGRKIKTKQEVIFVDAQAIKGSSGCPIFLWPGPRLSGNTYQMGGTKPYLLGIMHGFYPSLPREVIELKTSDKRQVYTENSGIAIIFPSWKLHDILESKSFKDRINDITNPVAKNKAK